MKNRKTDQGIWLDIGVLIVCLAIVTSCLSSGMLAKYVNTADGATGARAAKYVVSADLSEQTTSPEGEAVYTVTLKNASEVASKYSITLVFGDGAKGLKVTVGNTTKTVGDSGVVEFDNAGSIAANEQTKTVEIRIARGSIDPAADVKISFTAKVLFEQID